MTTLPFGREIHSLTPETSKTISSGILEVNGPGVAGAGLSSEAYNSVKNLAAGKKINVSDACTYLSEVGLCARDYIDREVNASLSGGELKRIELAISLAKGGEVFLFDEPEAGIDLWSFDDLIGIFKKLKDKTIIIVSHQKKILEIADKVLLMSNQDYQLGDKEEMLGNMTPSKCARLEVRDE